MDCFRPALKSSLPIPNGSVGTEPGVRRIDDGMTAMCLIRKNELVWRKDEQNGETGEEVESKVLGKTEQLKAEKRHT